MKKTFLPPKLPAKEERKPRVYPILSFDEIKSIIEDKCGNVAITEHHGAGENKVVILPEAMQEFISIVSYRRQSPMNHMEQKYIGLGHIFSGEDQNIIIVVSHFIQIHTTTRSTVSAGNIHSDGSSPGLDFLEYYSDEYRKLEFKYNTDSFGFTVDPFLKFGSSEYCLEGHTHPNNLDVFFSSTDRESGKSRACASPISIFVSNPTRCKMLGAIGKDFSPAEIIVYERVNTFEVENQKHRGAIIPPALSSVEDILSSASSCLKRRRCAGRIRCYRSKLSGKIKLNVKLSFPRNKRNKQ